MFNLLPTKRKGLANYAKPFLFGDPMIAKLFAIKKCTTLPCNLLYR